MGFRLSMLRNIEKKGLVRSLLSGTKRYAVLTLVGIIFYSPLDWRGWWDALVDIGLAGLLALPFIPMKTRWRVAAAFGYMALYQYLFTCAGYGNWTMEHSFDGGPLGPLSWVFCLLLGTIAYDIIATRNTATIVKQCLAWGIGLSIIGWALRAQWPGVKEFWPFSQKAMSAPYPIYATGLSFLIYLVFHILSDVKKIELPTFTVLGSNPLVIYILHIGYMGIHGDVIPKESSAPVALLAFAGLYAICYIVARYLYDNKYYVKI
jgi:hypothetical protein